VIEIICLNHILGKCLKCWSDEKNKQCEGYVPTKIFIFEVKEGDKDVLRNTQFQYDGSGEKDYWRDSSYSL
jgi:hypothetical protein